jgi:hypothetical protein
MSSAPTHRSKLLILATASALIAYVAFQLFRRQRAEENQTSAAEKPVRQQQQQSDSVPAVTREQTAAQSAAAPTLPRVSSIGTPSTPSAASSGRSTPCNIPPPCTAADSSSISSADRIANLKREYMVVTQVFCENVSAARYRELQRKQQRIGQALMDELRLARSAAESPSPQQQAAASVTVDQKKEARSGGWRKAKK